MYAIKVVLGQRCEKMNRLPMSSESSALEFSSGCGQRESPTQKSSVTKASSLESPALPKREEWGLKFFADERGRDF